jgi:hypothetical protein
MSDNQIRDIFANAEDWSPANDAGDGSDSTINGTDTTPNGANATTGSGNSTPSTTRPTLRIGSDVEIANAVAQILLQQRGEVVFAEGSFLYYAGSH